MTDAARLLVVDDDEEALRLLAEVLEREGYTVVRALTVEQALRALDGATPFDAVLTDLRMPGASGLDLLREVRSRDPRSLVFVLTAEGFTMRSGPWPIFARISPNPYMPTSTMTNGTPLMRMSEPKVNRSAP